MVKIKTFLKYSAEVLALGAALVGAPAYAAFSSSSFTMGVDNTVGFHGAANGVSAGMIVGSQVYGIVSADSIMAGSATTWNAVSTGTGPYDNLSGYFAAKVASTTTDSFGITSINLVPLAAGDSAPNNASFVADGQTIFQLYNDTTTAFESNGTPVDDISKATDGTSWANLGITDSGYWTVTMFGATVGSTGAMNLTSNNTGLSWGKVTGSQSGCAATSGCDMTFSNTFTANSDNNGWAANTTGTLSMHPLAVPLPAAAWLLLSGLAGLAGVNKRKRASVTV